MHILIVALHRPLKPTGVCRHAANLALCLAATEPVSHVTLVVGAWQAQYFKSAFSLSSEKIQLVEVDIKNTSFSRNFWYLFGLPDLVKEISPDLVHLSFPLPFARSSFPCPVVSTIHDLYPYECPKNFGYPQVWFNQLFLKQCVYGSNGISCVSKSTLEALNYYFPHLNPCTETAVVYNYVDFSQVNEKVPASFDPGSSFLLCVAQHRKNKNLNLLIESYSHLIQQEDLDQNLRLVIVGSSGPETEKLIEQIQTLSLQAQIQLVSSIDDAELCWFYRHCKLFVIPSSTEGFCLPLAEALHLSCQVVCSDIPVFREIGSEQCRYFSLQKDAVENLTQALFDVLHQSTEAASDIRFSKLTAAHQYLALYAAIAPKSTP